MEKFIRRSTERKHGFERVLFQKLNLCELQGLVVNSEWDPTAGLEVFECDKMSIFNRLFQLIKSNNIQKFKNFLNTNTSISFTDIMKRLVLTNEINVPFYLIFYYESDPSLKDIPRNKRKETTTRIKLSANSRRYIIVQIKYIYIPSSKNNEYSFGPCYYYHENEFINWWESKKKTIQTKPFTNGADKRARNSTFDLILESYHLKWGGNIDAFMINSDNHHNIKCIIDFLSYSKTRDNHNQGDLLWPNANPSRWYDGRRGHGPSFNGFRIQTSIAQKLGVPHIIIYLDKENPHNEAVAIGAIHSISHDQINLYSYKGSQYPGDHIIRGEQSIISEINHLITSVGAPKIINY